MHEKDRILCLVMSASAVLPPYKLDFGYNGSSCFSFLCVFDGCKTAFSRLKKNTVIEKSVLCVLSL